VTTPLAFSHPINYPAYARFSVAMSIFLI
jgi:hypothetical protein